MQEHIPISITTIIRRSLGAVAIVIACLVAAYIVASFVDLFFPNTFEHGRDFSRHATLAAFFVACSTALWARSYARQFGTILMALGLMEVLAYILISTLSGSFVVGRFYFSWFLGVNTYIGLPWLCGVAIGFVWARGKIAGGLPD